MIRVPWLSLLLCVLTSCGGDAARAQKSRPLPDGETVLRAVEARWAAIADYTVTLSVTADIEKLDVPPMVVRMYFKQPDRTHFESEGFAVLPREALRLNPRGILERFTVEGVSRDSTGPLLRMRLLSRGEATPARRMTLIVDPVRSTIEGMESGTADGRRMRALFTYAVTGGFLLPASLMVEFVSDAPSEGPEPTQAPARPRQGKVTVLFTDYAVNTGLSDDLFRRKEP